MIASPQPRVFGNLPQHAGDPALPRSRLPNLAHPNLQNVPARAAFWRLRHFGVLLSFVLIVLLPVTASAWYLWARAADQFASSVGFSVRQEDMPPALALLGGIQRLSGSSSIDTDILYEYIYSQELVMQIDRDLDLRAKWSIPPDDPVFALPPEGAVEDLMAYWQRMVSLSYDSSTRLIEVRVLAFHPADAQSISTAILDRSAVLVNSLNDVARADSLRHAGAELDAAFNQLVMARQAVTDFRERHQIVDPKVDVGRASGLLASLEDAYARAVIDLDLIEQSLTSKKEAKMVEAARRVGVIEDRIAAERQRVAATAPRADPGIATLIAEYERLTIDREFAEGAYLAARTAFHAAEAGARRQERYLAAHVSPTLAETSRFPQRGAMIGVIASFLFMFWAIGTLIFYALRDRR